MEAAAMGGKPSTTPSTKQNRNSKSEYRTQTPTSNLKETGRKKRGKKKKRDQSL